MTDDNRVREILRLRAEALRLQQEAKDAGHITTALMLGSELALIDFTLDTEGALKPPLTETKRER